jgi:hypothetical protein
MLFFFFNAVFCCQLSIIRLGKAKKHFVKKVFYISNFTDFDTKKKEQLFYKGTVVKGLFA